MNDKAFDLLSRLLLVLILLVSIFPFYWMLANSVKSDMDIFADPLGLPAEAQFANYLVAWAQADLGSAFINSAIATGTAVTLIVVTGALAAYPLARMRFRGRTFFLILFTAGLIVAHEVVLIPLFNLFNTLGLLNSLWSVILTNSAFGLPLTIFLFWQFFRDVPLELEEAARIDGCGSLDFLWRILLPLSKPVIGSVIIFQGLFTWNEYLFALTFLRERGGKTLPVQLQVFFSDYSTNWALLFAALVMATLPVIVLYLSMQRSFVKGLTAGAVKG
ncbi:carbohydrate ABC transporter permease [Bauldia litoralis]|uniref:Raffinose/stachyose/melibiose transport system permease protein n=1 Tax=Bauldia litoralis TaxID=665467 RepID=A0A1G6BUW6_9HYPH|nr:carbohydrate ABC transporter permease [Bauldia litoralis]SDB24392.1 raffinose/stachyose/melibiose transport system permease protein [Bauldia litoralis]